MFNFAVLSGAGNRLQGTSAHDTSLLQATWTVKRDTLHSNSVPLVYRAFGGGTVLAKKGLSLRANVIGSCGQ